MLTVPGKKLFLDADDLLGQHVELPNDETKRPAGQRRETRIAFIVNDADQFFHSLVPLRADNAVSYSPIRWTDSRATWNSQG